MSSFSDNDYFTPEEYSQFMTLLDEYLGAQEIVYTVDDHILTVSTDRYGSSRLGIINLVQACKQMPADEWREHIQLHFEQLEQSHNYMQEFSARAHEYDKIKDLLGVRLYHNSFLDNVEENTTLTKQVTEDIMAMLVFDLPNAVMSVDGEYPEIWNKTIDELFTTGIANIKNKYELVPQQQELGDKKRWSIHNEHLYSPNVLLDMDNYPEIIGTYGTILAVPNRHLVLLYPIESMEVIEIVNMFTRIVPHMNLQGPGSISPCIYWHYNDVFTNIPFEGNDEEVGIYPPENFVEILNKINNDVGEGD
ncbi:hypothetical protein [Chitinophaga sancti]|uniref:Uncharacterized protein n=1 Tax=Chitinophaga sancti TaxID=1004 RepID=A0A1K1RNQ3_9BACT|nr:hypothetical protein [Chitinophaga sancti]WQD62596.1 hypothetical protein U0033_32395 [Chitinophaga sancti]WQG91834.1 hypothetical protein SR876_09990 [Chitinophaga sancti]SFW73654.1 hypothetical protein SAMN05661012_04035 [Chitinophaga sancti]